MQSRAEWLRESDSLLREGGFERYAKGKMVNVAATARILCVDRGQVAGIMRQAGFSGARVGKDRLYDKASVYEAAKERGLLS